MALLACGSDSTNSSGPDAELADCLEGHDVDPSLEDFDFRRQSEPEFEEAVQACAERLDVEFPYPGDLTQVNNTLTLQVVDCLRSKGWDVPDPIVNEYGLYSISGADEIAPPDKVEALWNDMTTCENGLAPEGQPVAIDDVLVPDGS